MSAVAFAEAVRELPCPHEGTSLLKRFWPKVDVRNEDDCWLWKAAVNDAGYGVIGRGGRGSGLIRAHHVSWELHNRMPVPHGLVVRHMCEDRYARGDITCRKCVNWNHLRLGTFAENSEDCRRAGRASTPPVFRGAENHLSKFSDQLIKEAQQMLRAGARRRDVMARLGISKTHVGRIARGEHAR